MNIVIIGVGYVGLVSGLAFAKTDNNVQFLDLDVSKIDDLKKKKAPFFELCRKNISTEISRFPEVFPSFFSSVSIVSGR